MKRCIAGVWLLVFLLGLGIFSTWGAGKLLSPIAKELEASAELALSGDWASAEPMAENARQRWETQWSLTASLSNHGPMENADNWFDRVRVYAEAKDPVRFAEACTQIASLIDAIAEAQIPSLRNLL